MHANRFDLWELANRVRNGDSAAAVMFLSELERQIMRMIRRQVRSGRAASEVDQRIAAAIGQLLGNDVRQLSVNRTVLLEEATHRICLATLEAIRSSRNGMETIPDP